MEARTEEADTADQRKECNRKIETGKRTEKGKRVLQNEGKPLIWTVGQPMNAVQFVFSSHAKKLS